VSGQAGKDREKEIKFTMLKWNVLVTASERQERALRSLLFPFGIFKESGFRGTLIGFVSNLQTFLESLKELGETDPQSLQALGQVVPIDRTFSFSAANFIERAKEAIAPYLETIDNEKIYVRVKRRGYKGRISSLESEKELDEWLLAQLEMAGKKARIDFEAPDKIVVIEMVQNQCGVGLITKEMKERVTFIKIK
jgi:tRNA(Ser,Leu) C12 N-acetylase TAN1